jgi:hypothetical protein
VENAEEVQREMQKKSGPVVVKSGKTAATGVTPATVRTLERAGLHESAKIAREIVKK